MTPALPITLEQYLGKYLEHPDCTPGVKGNAIVLLDLVNAGLLLAQGDGVQLRINPVTGSLVAGSSNGGFRPDEAVDRNGRPVGAGHSWHKRHYDEILRRELGPAACDVFDPARELCAWSLRNAERLVRMGILGMEDPRWTPSWCHWQIHRVSKFCYVPSADAPLAAALPEQRLAA
jgi:hypothetical protein